MIKSHGAGFITVGEKKIPVKSFTIDAFTVGTITYSATASTVQSSLDVIDSTAVVIDDDVKALPAPDAYVKMWNGGYSLILHDSLPSDEVK